VCGSDERERVAKSSLCGVVWWKKRRLLVSWAVDRDQVVSK
jgi:hypothetical protein